jgi:hypothetical protein
MRTDSDDFWADTPTPTIYALLDTRDFGDIPNVEEFERTLRRELTRRGQPQPPFRLRPVS